MTHVLNKMKKYKLTKQPHNLPTQGNHLTKVDVITVVREQKVQLW